MSWILREGYRNLTVRAPCTLLLIELCQIEDKAPFWQVCRSLADPQSNAISFEHRVSEPNLHDPTQPFILTSPIEYP